MASPPVPSTDDTQFIESPSGQGSSQPVVAPTDPTLAHLGRPLTARTSIAEESSLLDPTDKDGPGVSASASSSTATRSRMPLMVGYDLMGELGRGGMGVVYRAKQTRLNRLVALKMLLHHDLADPSDVVRFRSEAEAVAAVKHPNVVQVYEFGHVDGRPYFAMEFLAGGSLHARLKTSAPFSPEESAALVEKLARAVHAAHAQGIIHRDIKPGNVLFDTAGEPRVTDFGLAKRVSSDLTQTQAVMGTPAYMAPEQASGRAKFAGPAADIYALGVILYECLTGTTPFRDEDSIRLITQVIQDVPPSIRSRVPTVQKDLERICLKCLEKDPNDRYATAAALADDLRHFLDGEPVSVRPSGLVEQLVKWARRRPMAALAYGLSLLVAVLTTFGAVVLMLWFRADAARVASDQHLHDAEVARQLLSEQNNDLVVAQEALRAKNVAVQQANANLANKNTQLEQVRDELRTKNGEVSELLTREQEALNKEKSARTLADQARSKLEKLSYFRNVGFANKELKDGNYLRAIQLLDDCPEASRKWEWWHVYRAAHTEFGSGVCGNTGLPVDVAFQGKTNNVVTAHPLPSTIIRFDFARGSGQNIKLHNDAWLTSMRLSEDGNRILTIRTWDVEREDGVEVWDFEAGVRLAAWKSPRATCCLEMLSGNGKRVIVGYQGQTIRSFDVDTGKELGKLNGVVLTDSVKARMSYDGSVAAVIDGKNVVVWRVETGEVIQRIPPGDALPVYVAVSPDANQVLIGDAAGTVRFYRLDNKKSLVGALNHGGPVSAMAWSRDGKMAASAGEDGVVRLWQTATAKIVKECHGHTRKVYGLRFSADGRYVVSTDALGGFRVWDVHEYNGPMNEAVVGENTIAPYFLSPDLNQLFSTVSDKLGVLSNYSTGQTHPFILPPGGLGAVAFQPGGPQIAIGGVEGHLVGVEKVPSVAKGFGLIRARIDSLNYTPNGKYLLAIAEGQVTLWDAAKYELLFSDPGYGAGTVAAVSPDGKTIAIGKGMQLRLWDVKSNQMTMQFVAKYELSAVGFTPASDRLVVGTREWKLETWDLKAGPEHTPKVLSEYVGHTSAVHCFAYNADGSRLATGSADGMVKIWDVASGQEALGLITGSRKVISQVFWAHSDILAVIPEGQKPLLYNGQRKHHTIRPDRPR